MVEQFLRIQIVGQCPALAEMPACSVGLTATKDGLPVYVLLCPELYDRPGLALSRGPIFGLVARLVSQKGVDLVLSAADEIIAAGGQIIVTGSGEPAIEQALVDAHRRRPDAIGVAIGFNDGQARRIFAGSDFTLMPSRFEPCGLSQMYAQRFGSLPIGHQTGGLAETITDGETGFLFDRPSTESFLGGVRRAFSAFNAKDRLDAMRRSAMSRSFNWGISATCDNALYRKALSS